MSLVMPMVRIRLKCADVEAFVARYHADVNTAGIFVRTRSPLPAETAVSFDFRLADGSCLFRGRGVILWSRSDDMLAPLLDAGMMLGFDELRDGTSETFVYVLARKRALEEAADTVPTLVRTFSGERGPLPMTTEMTADELGELRARVRSEMLADGNAPAPPVELGVEAAPSPPSPPLSSPLSSPPPSSPVLPALVPAEAREPVEARPLPTVEPSPTRLGKILMLPPQAGRPADGDTTFSTIDETLPHGDVTGLIATPASDRHLTRLLALALGGWMLVFALLAVIRLNLVQRMLEWLRGA
jgi:hypothetical protein